VVDRRWGGVAADDRCRIAACGFGGTVMGDIIPVRVDGLVYLTALDGRGVQRFIEDRDHWLVKQIPKTYDRGAGRMIDDMNVMAIRFHKGQFNRRDYMEMNMAVGYSVSGFCDIFSDAEIENPLWPEDADDPRAALLTRLAEALRGVMDGSVYTSVEVPGVPTEPFWKKIKMPDPESLDAAREALAEFETWEKGNG
jgi:hypothetical protein